ncbi:Increased DNA methylation 1 [Bienertia sinuspersici]
MPNSGHDRKRRPLLCYNKLRSEDKVEVRSIEDGFLGSWHAGEIVAFENGYPKVKYEHLLQDNNSDFLIEIVEVKLNNRILNKSKTCKRGRIRPTPPSGELTIENLCYGLCVDGYYNDAWWEGVVFDHKDGSRERKIFFPDLGDELSIDVEHMRLTHDWNEVTNVWKPREKMVVSRDVEEFERECFIPVSLKQIWYDIRSRREFDRIGEWPFPVKPLWEKLIKQIIDDNLRLTIDALVKNCISSIDMSDKHEVVPALESAPFIDPISVDTHAVVAPDLQNDEPMISELCENENAEIATDLPEFDPTSNQLVPVQPQVLSVISSDQKGLAVNTMPESESDENKQMRRNKRKLLADQSEFDLTPVFCPESMYDYVQRERPANALTTKVRSHLRYLGYTMEYHHGRKTVCYISPKGRKFHSLRSCLNFEMTGAETSSLAAEDIPSGTISSSDNLKGTSMVKVSNNRKVRGQNNTKVKLLNLNVEPKYCPELVTKYVRSSIERCRSKESCSELQNEVRSHLSAIGWKFWAKIKKGKEEWRYDSPTTSKTYYSLMSACRAIKEGIELQSSSPIINAFCENSNSEPSLSDKEVPGFPFCKKWSRKLPRSFKKYKARKVQRRMQNGLVHSMLNGVQEQEAGDDGFAKKCSIRRLSNRFLSLEKESIREKVLYYRQDGDQPIAEGRITNSGINCSCCRQVFSLSSFEAHAGSISNKPAANIFFYKDGNRWTFLKVIGFVHHAVVEFVTKAALMRIQIVLIKAFYLVINASGYVDHAYCINERDLVEPDVHRTENWFCSKMCERNCEVLHILVHWGLQQLLGKPILVGHNNLTWTLIKPMDYQAIQHDDCDVVTMAENYSKLNVALEVMHECFEPVKEPRTKRDLVEDVIFCRGSHLNRLNFRGFYTVLLERNDELITVASLRVYGDKVAEIPLIGTRFKHRRLGMCRIVVQEIEKNLIDLGVKRLVLPAAASVLHTWTTAFGYTPVTASERSEFLIHQTIEGTGTIADPEGNSAISDVSQEDLLEGSKAVVQGTLVKWLNCVTDELPTNQESEPCSCLEFKEQKIERDKCDGIKIYKRKKAPQAEYPKLEVSCR